MIIDELDDIKCEECYRLAIEALCDRITSPQNLARPQAEYPAEAMEMRSRLRRLLDLPNGTLEEPARALAARAKARVGIFQN